MNSKNDIRLVGDIGGTNARFALVDEHFQPQNAKTYAAAEYPTLADALRQYLSDNGLDKPSAIALAVATRVLGDHIAFTNINKWSFSIDALRKELDIADLHVVNDFTAQALAVPHIDASQLKQVGGGHTVAAEPIGILGPGTGLGVSGLIPLDDAGKKWRPLKSEGGHMSMAPVTDRENAVLGVFAKRFGHVSYERFLSGPGLVNIYSALRELDGLENNQLEPAEITAAGLALSDEHARETLDMFCCLLGTAASDLAVTLGAFGGVFIGGGIVPKLGDFFVQSQFRERFEFKGRVSDEVVPIATIVIHDPYPGLLGAAQILR